MSTPSEEDERLLLFYDTLISVLRETIGGRYPKALHILPRPLQKYIREAWTAAEEFLGQVDPKSKHRGRLSFYHLIIEIVVTHIESLERMPVTLRTVAQFTRDCGPIVSQQFPNYKRAGLLHLAMKWGRPGATLDEEEL